MSETLWISEEAAELVQQVLTAIDEGSREIPREPRSYIGASGIGTKCNAELEFGLRGFPADPPEPKLARIFRDGHRIERTVVTDLKKAGYFVMEVDAMTGRQFRYEMAGGHVVCNTDGMIALDKANPDEVSLLEIKSMNDDLWEKFKKHGVKVSHPKYWDQMQMMMGMSGLTRCLFIAYNKNNSLYWAQIVDYDEFEWAYLRSKIVEVFEGAAKVSDKPESFLCRFCFRKSWCWDEAPATTKCQTCALSKPTDDGSWWCTKHEREAAAPCSEWRQWKPKEKK